MPFDPSACSEPSLGEGVSLGWGDSASGDESSVRSVELFPDSLFGAPSLGLSSPIDLSPGAGSAPEELSAFDASWEEASFCSSNDSKLLLIRLIDSEALEQRTAIATPASAPMLTLIA